MLSALKDWMSEVVYGKVSLQAEISRVSKVLFQASNQRGHEQRHPAKTLLHCEAAKWAGLQFLSLWTKSHNSLELPELWQTLIDTWTAPTHGCSDHPCSWRQLWMREWIIAWWEGMMVICSLGSIHASWPRAVQEQQLKLLRGAQMRGTGERRREGKSSQRDDASKWLFQKTALKPTIKSLK